MQDLWAETQYLANMLIPFCADVLVNTSLTFLRFRHMLSFDLLFQSKFLVALG